MYRYHAKSLGSNKVFLFLLLITAEDEGPCGELEGDLFCGSEGFNLAGVRFYDSKVLSTR